MLYKVVSHNTHPEFNVFWSFFFTELNQPNKQINVYLSILFTGL